MAEPMGPAEAARQDRSAALYHLTKTDPDPRVRRRAHALLLVAAGRCWSLLVAEGHSQASAARLLHTSAYRIHIWQDRFAADGRAGLVDRPRGGRPHALSAADRAFLEAALEQGPQAYGLPMTMWSIRDLQALLQREGGVEVSVYTVHRAVHELGFCYRRPRHDLTHRQDAQAVAAAGRVLDWLPKKRLLSQEDSIWSMWTSAKSTPIPTWQRSGVARGSR